MPDETFVIVVAYMGLPFVPTRLPHVLLTGRIYSQNVAAIWHISAGINYVSWGAKTYVNQLNRGEMEGALC